MVPDGNRAPLKFAPRVLQKVWGGDYLQRRFPALAADEGTIGEVWLASPELPVVPCPPTATGEPAGQPLADLPLLVKLIHARENLSVQVHPDDDYARAHEPQPVGKTEMWYVLHAEPGAQIILGPKRPLTPDTLRAALADESLPAALNRVDVAAGDVVFIPAGTIHALGAGVVVYELQQPSDITYRLYDWGREQTTGLGRELHVDKALDVASLEPPAMSKIEPITVVDRGVARMILGACRYFAAELLSPTEPTTCSLAAASFHLVTVLAGSAAIQCANGPLPEFDIGAGESTVIPQAVAEYTIVPLDQPVELIHAYVPNLQRDIIAPLLERGVPVERILRLGGGRADSDLCRAARAMGIV